MILSQICKNKENVYKTSLTDQPCPHVAAGPATGNRSRSAADVIATLLFADPRVRLAGQRWAPPCNR
jgi:hypothetical protein